MDCMDYRKELCYPENVIASLGISEIDADNISFDQMQGAEYCIYSLGDTEQYVIEQFFKHGRSFEEIALTMMVSKDDVIDLITDAMKKLKKPTRKRVIVKGISILEEITHEDIERRYRDIEKQKKEQLRAREKESMRRVGHIMSVLNKLEQHKKEIEAILGNDIETVIKNIEQAKSEANLDIRHLQYAGEMSAHLFNSLARKYGACIKITDFSNIEKEEIALIKGFGTRRLVELEHILKRYGVELKDTKTAE